LYPRKEFRLPDILSQEQIIHLLQNIKKPQTQTYHWAILRHWNATWELCKLKMEQIGRKSFQIKIVGGKGNKDRFTLLPKQLLPEMETYYRRYRPKSYLFEGRKAGLPLNDRSIQDAVRKAMKD
jgi:integrase/recombinase XerD